MGVHENLVDSAYDVGSHRGGDGIALHGSHIDWLYKALDLLHHT